MCYGFDSSTNPTNASISTMAELDANIMLQSSDVEDDNRPIALRRKRRTSSACSINASHVVSRPRPSSTGINTPPTTPQRSKKRVRFSDPGPAIPATGLTPFIRRTSLGTPSSSQRSRSSASRWNLQVDDSPISGVIQFEPLRQILDGRVKRRIRRNKLSEETHLIESELRDEGRIRRETDSLRAQLQEKDRQIATLRAGYAIASYNEGEAGTYEEVSVQRMQELKRQIDQLREELDRHQDNPNWTMAAKDPWDEDDDAGMPNFEEDDMSDIITSTPSRQSRAIPSPPATAPTTPSKAYGSVDVLTQADLPDPELETLEVSLRQLREKVESLQSAINANRSMHSRLLAKLAPHISVELETADLDIALDDLLTTLVVSLSSATESDNRFSALANEISELGFPDDSPDCVLDTLRVQFRNARIEFERLHPGETVEGFKNDKLLALLIERLRVLTDKVRSQEADIDQYHELEISLRQQLGSRVDVQVALEEANVMKESEVALLRTEIVEGEENVRKLTQALESYRVEVARLEACVVKYDADNQKSTEEHHKSVNGLKEEMKIRARKSSDTIASLKTEISTRSKTQSNQAKALAMKDARVSELRIENERIGNNLIESQNIILGLRNDNRRLRNEISNLKDKLVASEEHCKSIEAAMKKRLQAIIDEDRSIEPQPKSTDEQTNKVGSRTGMFSRMRLGGRMSGAFARRTGSSVGSRDEGSVGDNEDGCLKKTKRDSGLAFLEEDEIV